MEAILLIGIVLFVAALLLRSDVPPTPVVQVVLDPLPNRSSGGLGLILLAVLVVAVLALGGA
jgi:hypothetical protein